MYISCPFMWLFDAPNLRNIGNLNESLSLPFSASNCGGTMATDFPLSSNMTTSSCMDESGFLQSSENVNQANTPTETFVKTDAETDEAHAQRAAENVFPSPVGHINFVILSAIYDMQ
ncbi:hypothetical protein TSUD_252070 [Trifolium subterraneum]|uniref:Uncharacterized protein n=1 Tax=Trifolium subterraneum TaxID=3900 RepID=A0A2Z6MTB6_TRISU|nr:hypothetical protein TSUD_252070 [Trifolium subterraneum]